MTPEQLRELVEEVRRGEPIGITRAVEVMQGYADALEELAFLKSAHTADVRNAEIRAERAEAALAECRARLEVDPRTKYDGIDCRDETIRLLEERLAEAERKCERKKCCLRADVVSTHWEGCHTSHPECAAYKAGREAGMREAAEICLKQADKTRHTEAWNDGCEGCNYAILAAIWEGGMSELTKRLRKWQYEYEITDFGDAADRIDALEDSERVILASVPEEHRASTAAGTAQNYIAHLEGRIDALEEVLRELIDKGDTFGGELRVINREDERAALDKARALLEGE